MKAMKQFKVIKKSSFSFEELREKVEESLNKLANDGYEIVSVSITRSSWGLSVAFITTSKEM